MNKKLCVAVLACTIFFGATCFGQKGNPAPKGGEKIEKVVPQDNAPKVAQADGFPLTQEQLNYNHLTLIYAKMM
ncbi:MAG: hypothetical protein ACOX3T_03790 [Bdellovibrionota bacterium]